MADIGKLIDIVMAEVRKDNKNNKMSKLYRDEPILITASQMATFTPQKIRDMRSLAKRRNPFMSDAEIFYNQAKFMEDYDDNYEYHGEFSMYYPTYQAMNDMQLRAYFTWRSAIRRGEVKKTFLSFAFVYIYELLNGIGCSSPEESFKALGNFREAYSPFDNRIDAYTKLWLRDYAVYYSLPMLEGTADSAKHTAYDVARVLDYKNITPEQFLQAVNSLSAYNIVASRVHTLHSQEVENAVYSVFSELFDSVIESGGSVLETYFGRIVSVCYYMFRSAVVYEREKHPDSVYKVNDFDVYSCENGAWSNSRLLPYSGKSKQITSLLKRIDYELRAALKVKPTIKKEAVTAPELELILGNIKTAEKKVVAAKAVPVNIDLSLLEPIREAASKTRDRLVTEDELFQTVNNGETAVPENQCEKACVEKNSSREYPAGLSSDEYGCIVYLLYKKGQCPVCATPLSVLADSINEKLFDTFGDNVIDFSLDTPEIIEDYAEELKGIVSG